MSKHLRPRNSDVIVYAIIISFFLGLAAVIFIAATNVAGLPYSQGERVGVITKLSNKGLFCKTWEGEMNLGGFRNKTSTDKDGNSTTSVVANIFEFSVTDPEIVTQIQEAMNQGEAVGLMYEQYLIHNICKSSTGYIITRVRK